MEVEGASEGTIDQAKGGEQGQVQEDTKKLAEKIKQLEDNRNQNPNDYDANFNLILTLRNAWLSNAGEASLAQDFFVRLRHAREVMSDIFPLPVGSWVEWLDDETGWMQGKKQEEQAKCKEKLKELHETSVEDYLSVDLWIRHAEFLWKQGEEKDSDVRAMYELAITEAGRHMAEGKAIWQSYREYLKENGGSVEDIRLLFTRELSIPYMDMEQTMSQYINWETTVSKKRPNPETKPELFKAYSKAKAERDKRIDLEEKLIAAAQVVGSSNGSSPGVLTMEQIALWDAYIALEDKMAKGKYSDRTKTLYERALSHGFLHHDLWRRYLQYVKNVFKNDDWLEDTYHRAIRNCKQDADLWIGLFRLFEKRQDEQSAKNLMAKLDSDGTLQPEIKAKAFLEFCDRMRRRCGVGGTNSEPPDAKSMVLRAVFDAYSQVLKDIETEVAKSHDLHYNLYSYWADVEMRWYGDIEQSRIHWETLIRWNSQDERVWRSYIYQERIYGDLQTVRDLYKRAVSSLDTSHHELKNLCDEWVKFERECGSLETLETAEKRASLRITKWTEHKQQCEQQQYYQLYSQQLQQQQHHQQQQNNPKSSTSSKTVAGQKRKRDDRKEDEKDGQKTDHNPKAASSSSSAPTTNSDKRQRRHAPSAGGTDTSAISDNGEGKKNEDEAASLKWKVENRKEENTIFAKNLAYDTTDEQIKTFFSKVGEISQIRHIRDGKGKSKGYAYIEYVDAKSVDQAYQNLQLRKINKRAVQLSRCSVPSSNKGGKRGGGKKKKHNEGYQRPEPKTVYIRPLPRLDGELRTVPIRMEEHLRGHFKECGEIKAVRLTLDKRGKLKRFAFIEFQHTDSVTKAIKLSGTHLKDHPGKKPLSVMKSCPPSKKKQILNLPKPEKKTIRKRGRAMLSLVPRSISKPSGGKKDVGKVTSMNIDASSSKKEGGEGETKMKDTLANVKPGTKTNAHFRAMLLNKSK
eukprot:jgi/Bigna1/134521/aug1.25_g9229